MDMDIFTPNPDVPLRRAYANRGTGLVRPGCCGQVFWQSGEYTSHCTVCCRTFTSLQGFDIHHPESGGCADPADMRDDRGRQVFDFLPPKRDHETVRGYWRYLRAADRPEAALVDLPGPESGAGTAALDCADVRA